MRCQAESEEIGDLLQEQFRLERAMRAFTPERLSRLRERLRAVVRNIPWTTQS